MGKHKIFKALIFFTSIMVFLAGCENTDFETENIEKSFYVDIEYPLLQEVYNEGFPKDIKAQAYRGEKELNNNVTFIWTSDIDGDITEGNVLSTEYLSVGEHLITLNAYDKNGNAASDTVRIKKVGAPIRKNIEQKALSPRKVTDRIDGTVYVDNRDGTVTDTSTHLMWELSDDGYRRNVSDAYRYCEELSLAGHSDWRMPTINELEDIANIGKGKKQPIICQVFDTKNASYWSQTESSSKLFDHPNRNYYRYVKFIYSRYHNGLLGKSIPAADANSKRYVRCVR